MIQPLTNPGYFEELKKRIGHARKSIVAVNYLAEFSEGRRSDADPVRVLASTLIKAKRRGVSVSIILEGSKLDQNYPFYRLMRDRSIDCWLDTSKTLIHQKTCLIDDRLLFAGSHNWAWSSLSGQSKEFSVLTDDETAIRAFKREFADISRQRDAIRSNVSREITPLPSSLLQHVVPSLFRAHAMLAFDLYTILCRQDGGTPKPQDIDEEGWGAELGFDPCLAGESVGAKYRKYYYTQRLNRILSQLKNRFRLITVDRHRDQVTRLGLPHGKGVIEMPLNYWRYRWPVRLSFAAKYFYLISVFETKESPFYPWWSRPILELGREYRCSAQNISRGARELAQYNILDILRAVPKKIGGRYAEEAQFYRNNPFYDMAGFEAGLGDLEEKYSGPVTRLSREVAQELSKSHDLNTLEEICSLIRRHGPKEVMKASRKIAATPLASSRRVFGHLLELLEVTPRGKTCQFTDIRAPLKTS